MNREYLSVSHLKETDRRRMSFAFINAGAQIIPADVEDRRIFLLPRAAREPAGGIIRVLRERREGGRLGGSGGFSSRCQTCGRARPPSVACQRADTRRWSQPVHGQGTER